MIESVVMNQHSVLTSDISCGYLLSSSNTCTLHALACIFKWSSYQPALFILINLVNTYLMTLAPILETRMIYQIGTSVLSSDNTIVTLSTLSPITHCLEAPVSISTEDIHTTLAIIFRRTEVQLISIIDCGTTLAVNVWSIRIQ